MKFLCENCKAKYQIADDKVAGKTVRMKCRKCGNSIEIRAAVTETSVASKLADGAPAAPRPASTATRLSQSAATTGSGASGGALAGAFRSNVQKEDEAPVAAMDMRELSAADEWYVAINGVPVGPVRIAEVRRKAATGAVTEDSLCWQEGMEEWRAVRTVKELAEVVREAAQGGRASQLPEVRSSRPPPAPRAPAPRAGGAPRPAAPRAPARPAAPAPARGGPAAAPIATYDEDAATIIGRSPFEPSPSLTNGVAASPDPFAPGPTPGAAHAPSPIAAAAAATSAVPVGDPFAFQATGQTAAAPAPAATAAEPYRSPPLSTPIVKPERKKPPNYIALGMIGAFCCFGIAAAFITLGAKPPQQIVVHDIVQVPASAQPGTATAPSQPETIDRVVIDAGPVKVAAAQPHAGGNSGSRPGGAAAAPLDPALRDLISGQTGGPSPVAGGGGGGGGGGAQLSEDEVRSVVTRYSGGIKRTCWDRIQTQSGSVNETVHIVVSGTGAVQSASATGNDGLVGKCLEDEVRRWRFPGGGTVDVPFHFLRQ